MGNALCLICSEAFLKPVNIISIFVVTFVVILGVSFRDGQMTICLFNLVIFLSKMNSGEEIRQFRPEINWVGIVLLFVSKLDVDVSAARLAEITQTRLWITSTKARLAYGERIVMMRKLSL